MAEQFQFPDEGTEAEFKEELIVTTEGDDAEVIIEDDTPEHDRRAQPLNREVQDPSEEEIEGYTKGVQSRIKELTHARHDERRAKETVLREKQELERLTKQILEENRALKQRVTSGEVSHAETLQAKAEADMEMARRLYKEAEESYDSEAKLEAQEMLTDAKMKLEAAKNFRPTPLQSTEKNVTIQPSVQEIPKPDDKTLRWQAKNQWFGQPGYEELTAFALGLHQKLVSTGIDPRSDNYFERIDSRLKTVFPEVFEDTASQKTEPARKPATVVASASRSTGAKKSVTLTKSQAALADKLGIPRDLYAKEFLKQEARNG
jgi:hypothetical protein